MHAPNVGQEFKVKTPEGHIRSLTSIAHGKTKQRELDRAQSNQDRAWNKWRTSWV